VIGRRRPLGIERQVPVIEQCLGSPFAIDRFAVIGLDRELPVPVQVLEVSSH
jgi:hypothetical protein